MAGPSILCSQRTRLRQLVKNFVCSRRSQLCFYLLLLVIGSGMAHWGVVLLAATMLFFEGVLWCQRTYAEFFNAVCTRTVRVTTKVQNLFIRSRWQWNSQTSLEDLKSEPFFPREQAIDGSISIVELALKHTFHYSTNRDGFRKSHEIDIPDSRPVIAVFGCSITFGTAISDEETYCWQLQQLFPEYCVHNYGVQGFSPYESLLLMKQVVPRIKPAALVFAYHPVHDIRNVGSYPYTWWMNQQPQCGFAKGKLATQNELEEVSQYRLPWSFGGSPTAIALLLFSLLQSPLFPRNRQSYIRVTMEQVFLAMKELCAEAHCPMLIAALDASMPHARFLEERGFAWSQSAVRFEDRSETGAYRWTLYPFDPHPNSAAHSEYAQDIRRGLSALLRGLHYAPPNEGARTDSVDPVLRRSEFSYPLY